ncbi:MAG: hypothetical protein JW801_05220 [Bacteroidales bacterium]|nr:hypothetical protein [Bacteroidales bacterium]
MFAENYFKKHSYILPEIEEPPSGLLWYSVVIPVFREEGLIRVLEALSCAEKPFGKHVELILVFNHPKAVEEEIKALNRDDFEKTLGWIEQQHSSWIKYIPLWVPDLPRKFAGAGIARKIGMDLALHRFEKLERKDGVILSLDADTLVQSNYFEAIQQGLDQYPGAGGCLISFAHPISGTEFQQEIYQAIMEYELHLRYYKHFLDFTGFPWSNYTIGSCFGVRAEIYAKQGGMNRRQAGEDFYFLNKLFPHYRIITITDTLVQPSPRISDRVPFGTGPAIARMLKAKEPYLTYAPESFLDLKKLFASIESLNKFNVVEDTDFTAQLSKPMQEFLQATDFIGKLKEIKQNTRGLDSFRKRFFLWFDAFRIVKYLNFSHEQHYSRLAVDMAVRKYFALIGIQEEKPATAELLITFREWDGISEKFARPIS